MAGHVEDPLLRIQRRELAAELGQRVDDARGRLAHAGPERGGEAHRAGADDRDVADLVEVGMLGHGERERASGSGCAVERREGALDGGRHAGEGRGVALRVGGGLGGAQALHEVEEGGGLVGLERDHELLVVEAEGVARVEVDLGVLAADADVLLHDLVALLRRQPVPLARLHERIDEQVLRVLGAHLEARLVGVLGGLGHGEERVGHRAPLHQATLREHHVELVDSLQVRRLRQQHQVAVPARADGAEGAQQALGGEVLAGGDELALVGRALLGIEAAPGRIDLQERVLDEMALGHQGFPV